jgi:hypothetical protein
MGSCQPGAPSIVASLQYLTVSQLLGIRRRGGDYKPGRLGAGTLYSAILIKLKVFLLFSKPSD